MIVDTKAQLSDFKLGEKLFHFMSYDIFKIVNKKSWIRETPTLSTDADSRIDTNLKRLRDL